MKKIDRKLGNILRDLFFQTIVDSFGQVFFPKKQNIMKFTNFCYHPYVSKFVGDVHRPKIEQ